MRILTFLIFSLNMNDRVRNPFSPKAQADTGSSGERWTEDRFVLLTCLKMFYLIQLLHIGMYTYLPYVVA